MLKTVAVDPKTKRALHVEEQWDSTDFVTGNEVLPVYLTTGMAHGAFTSASRSSAGTTVMVNPRADGSLILTDLVLGTDRVNNATVTVQITDGVQTETVFSTNVTDAPANIALSMAGRWQGWVDARMELVTTGSVNATVSVGYIKMPNGLPYDEWDALR